MAQVSAEVRLFLQVTDAVVIRDFTEWFNSRRILPGGGVKRRTDVYVVDDSTDELGIKDREGNTGLEVKSLVNRELCRLRFGGLDLTAQIWTKVTSKVLTLPTAPSSALATHKTRWLRKFETAGSTAIEVELGCGAFGEDPKKGPPPDVGCNVEWTLVKSPGFPVHSWTFGLEAFVFGQKGAGVLVLQDSLTKTLAELLSKTPLPPKLGTQWRELSYPAWIRNAKSERVSRS